MGPAPVEGAAVNRSLLAAVLVLACCSFGASAESRPCVIVVVGAAGEKEFGEHFQQWAERWEAASKLAQADYVAIGLDEASERPDREVLQQRVAGMSGNSHEALWVVLIGHGTYDGKIARFNMRGPDISGADLAEWLKPMERPIAIVDCSSASGPFLNALSGANRVVVSA
jgi:hypothetical protein